jgi:hypothetical protein
MAPRRTWEELKAMPRPGGALGAMISAAEGAPRTLPRDRDSRAALESVGERPERLGPAFIGPQRKPGTY